jgi:hypothetical protein
MHKLFLTAAAVFAASGGNAMAMQNNDTAAKPPPPCSSDLFHQFDFWIGEWEVFGPAGKKAGDNVISVEEYGCLLVERWTNTGGGTGQSYNFVDLATNKWRQVWVSKGATIDYSGGLNEDGAMHLVGEIAYPNGNKADFMGTWTLNEDGTVTQYFQQYDSEKEVWNDWFTGTYKKKGAN